jgi:uncharacterized repeat protein (TIGR03847 family)
MSSSFEFDPAERFTAGAVGEPGRRIFYLQAGGQGTLVTLLAEKEQVSALSQTIARLLELLPETEDEGYAPGDEELELVEPLLPEWRAGSMSLDYEESGDRVILVVQEALPEESEEEPATLRVALSRAQAERLAIHANSVVSAGRPQCRVCGLPMDPAGHNCPALNGHRELT